MKGVYPLIPFVRKVDAADTIFITTEEELETSNEDPGGSPAHQDGDLGLESPATHPLCQLLLRQTISGHNDWHQHPVPHHDPAQRLTHVQRRSGHDANVNISRDSYLRVITHHSLNPLARVTHVRWHRGHGVNVNASNGCCLRVMTRLQHLPHQTAERDSVSMRTYIKM